MKKWSILLTIAVVALLMPVSTASVSAQGELSISKSADPTSAAVGDNITYAYTITNNSDNVTDNVTLVDSNLALGTQGQISLSKTTLGPGDNVTATATYIVVEADLPGPLENTATASGTAGGNTVTDNATASVDLTYTASLQLTKVANPSPAAVGDNITYTYTITNNGNVTISNITLEDVSLGAISLSNTTLAPGNSTTATATYTVAQADLPGPIDNTATVSGTDPDSKTVTASATASVELTYNAGLQVTKVADRETASFNETITYTYAITNNGDATVSNITLADDKIPAVSLSSDNTTLAAGQSITAKGTYKVSIKDFFRKKAIINKADVTGVDPQGKLVTASATATVSVNKSLFWKHDILKRSGVPGKGIDKAPGLQKPFNPKSQAAEHAGKKNKPKTSEELQIRERTENQSSEDHPRIRSEVQNQAGGIHVVEDDDEDSDENAQLEENSVTDNQTQGPEVTQGNGHKPNKDKPNKNPNSSNNH